MTCSSKLALTLLVLAPLVHPRVAVADDDPLAARAFAQARRLFKARRFIRAAAAFEEAYRRRPHFLVLCSVARCHENLENMVRAAELYRRCLSEGADKTRLAPRIEASLQEVERQVTWVHVAADDLAAAGIPGDGTPGPTATGGDTVFIDGNEVGPAPGRYPVNPGRHIVEIRRPGRGPVSGSFTTRGGENRTLTLSPSAGSQLGSAIAAAAAATPSRSAEVARAGVHPGFFWATATVTVALAVTTAVLGFQTLDRRSAYEEHPTRQGYDGFTSRRALTNIFGAATAAAGATGVLLFFNSDFGGARREAEPRQTATIGASLRGQF